jgi:hypothetical protein
MLQLSPELIAYGPAVVITIAALGVLLKLVPTLRAGQVKVRLAEIEVRKEEAAARQSEGNARLAEAAARKEESAVRKEEAVARKEEAASMGKLSEIFKQSTEATDELKIFLRASMRQRGGTEDRVAGMEGAIEQLRYLITNPQGPVSRGTAGVDSRVKGQERQE